MLADPSVATFLAQAVPIDQWQWRVKRKAGNRTVTLADLGLSVPDTLAYSEDALRQLVIRHGDGTAVIEGTVSGVPRSPALTAHRRLRRLATLLAGHVRDEHAPELRVRLNTLLDAAQVLATDLAADEAGQESLRHARRWGIAPEPIDDTLPAAESLQSQLTQAEIMLRDRIERAQMLPSEVPAHQIAHTISELTGNALPIYGRAHRSALEAFGALAPQTTLNQDWLETVAAVRPPLARVEAHQLGADSPLNAWSNRADPWAFSEPEAGPRVKQSWNLVICYSPLPMLGDNLAVAVLDSWSEMIPTKRHIVEAGFGFNAPSSRAPQAILLAVPPDESQPLDPETLAHIVLEARETAHARMATPDDIASYAALFPFAMVPSQQPTGVGMRPIPPV